MQAPTAPLHAALASIEQEGIESEREQLLLWLIRSRFEVSTADSYEYVLPPGFELLDVRVDAAIVAQSREQVAAIYILTSESASDLRERAKALEQAFNVHGSPERELARSSARLRSILDGVATTQTDDVVRVILCVTTTTLKAIERSRIERIAPGSVVQIEVLDAGHLNALARAAVVGDRNVPDVVIKISEKNLLRVQVGNELGVVLPVYATAIADWPGIDDRTLFDLNVRHALGINRVRKSLDKALTDPNSGSEFIAYHNGITAVCDEFVLAKGELVVKGLSVVNGAQSVVAIRANQEALAPSIQLLLKLVQAPSNSELARSIAIRSNTQNPVTSRNLRALDDVQERLTRELAPLGYIYVARPDQATPSDSHVIRNDDVAQLLCSMYVRKPHLAVKRQVLFENPLYSEIFPLHLDPARVIFAHLTRQVVQQMRPEVPIAYQRAWALTALTIFYMTSEAMRADPAFSGTLTEPRTWIQPPEALKVSIEPYVRAACAALQKRAEDFDRDTAEDRDDFRVAFKQQRTLAELGAQAAKIWKQTSRRYDQ